MTPKTQHEFIAALAEIEAALDGMKYDIDRIQFRIHALEKKVLYEVGSDD